MSAERRVGVAAHREFKRVDAVDISGGRNAPGGTRVTSTMNVIPPPGQTSTGAPPHVTLVII